MSSIKSSNIKKIIEKYRVLYALGVSRSLMGWDESVNMPHGAAKHRGEIRAVFSTLYQKFLLDKELVEAVKAAEKEETLTDVEKGILRTIKREMKYFERIPPSLLQEIAKASSVSQAEWAVAKKTSDYNRFKPHLQKMFELSRQVAEKLGYEDHPYDALLDLFEEGLTIKDVDKMFSVIKSDVVPVFKKIGKERTHPLEEMPYDNERLKDLNLFLLKKLNYDFEHGRLDESPHPFTTSISLYDVRITTWYQGKDFRRSLLAVAHEFGHALYEMQINKEYAGLPIGDGVSMGIHEAQSRFWENHVGRSKAFVEKFYDFFIAFMPELSKYTVDDVYEYFNLVRPELVRVEADEVHYPLHILLRYEIEKGLIDESLNFNELPQIWNEKMENYIGIVPKKDADGVLQDIHWSYGAVGYFPTYAFGTIISAQMRHYLEKDLGPLDDLILKGDFKAIQDWQKEKIHQHGAVYPPKELLKRAFGEEMNPKYFIEHLKKYEKLWA